MAALSTWKSKYERMKASSARVRAKAGETVINLVGTGEIAGTAFAFGYAQGRWGAKDVLGIPIDLALGMGFHGLCILGVVPQADSHLRNIGNGAIASYAFTVGRGKGATATAVTGALPRGREMSGAVMEDDELVETY